MSEQEERNSFIQIRLQEVSAELTDAQANLETLYNRLDAAETELRFYAEPTNYKMPKQAALADGVFQHALPTDCESVGKKTFVGGKRARAYFKRFNPLSDS